MTAANPLTLGRVYNGNAYRLPGTLDDVRVYNRFLTATEIGLLMQNRSYSYDAKGNLTSDRVWGYQYDHENRLTVATNGAVRADYRYDALGRQIERRTSGSSVTTNRLYYAGWQLIAEYNGTGALQRKYVYGPGIDEPVRMTNPQSPTPNHYFHADGLGSVTEITTNGGFKVESYTYDVYGTPTIYSSQSAILAASAVGNRLLFTGRDRDPDTTLYNYRHRYYSPSLGRFVQVDPVGLVGGDVHHYRYVLNNPVNAIDPTGKNPVVVVLVVGGLYLTGTETANAPGEVGEVSGQTGEGIGNMAITAGSAVAGGALFEKLAPFVSRAAGKVGTVGRNIFHRAPCPGARTVDKFSRTPKSLMDETVLDAAKQGKGQKIIENLGDPQFRGMEKWSYGETSASGLRSEVHYVRDPKTGKLMDFKFKHHVELYK